ncbi:MAG: hypothetical protein JJU03_10410 [Idiomarina sp.]|nr:hypothetical protein [Idiomarina sp.]
MKNQTAATKKSRFVPNIENFKTSLMYEGIKLKGSVEGQTIESLKRKYAR